MRAVVKIYLEDPNMLERIYKSLLPDIKTDREKISLKNKNLLIFQVKSENFSHILAAFTSLLKLINETIKLEKSLEKSLE